MISHDLNRWGTKVGRAREPSASIGSIAPPSPKGGPILKFSSLQYPQFTFTIPCIYLNYRKLSCRCGVLMGHCGVSVEMAEVI